MGNLASKGLGMIPITSKWVIKVKTMDRKGAGTDANVYVILYDDNDLKTDPIYLNHRLRNNFEKGCWNEFGADPIPKFGKVEKIELWRDSAGFKDDWFVEVIDIEDRRINEVFHFPVLHWIKPDKHYTFTHLHVSLPQFDDNPEQRRELMEDKKKIYEYVVKQKDLPVLIKDMPEDEKFSFSYQWDIAKQKNILLVKSKLTTVLSRDEDWDELEDIQTLFGGCIMPRPKVVDYWQTDTWFGQQRLSGCNPKVIKLCTKIPENFGVTAEMVAPFLEGMSLDQALQAKKIFICDLKALEGVHTKFGMVLTIPLALFFVNGKNILMPIAIQLFQESSDTNPVFLPSDPKYTWLLAKMWYNLADVSYHQGITHLGTTHFLMEGICVATNRCLSPNHPIFKLLAPHFLYLIAIDNRALQTLLSPGGWVDKTMTIGVEGAFDIVARGTKDWKVNVDGLIDKELESRGVLDPDVLPTYYYREDSLELFRTIRTYVAKVVKYYYDSPEKLTDDHELQQWGKELTAEKGNGLGLKGVPGDGKFSCTSELIDMCTCIISTCSLSHAAANFPQYEDYAYVPNYPAFLTGKPPTDKSEKQKSDIKASLPDMSTTLNTIVVTKILSNKGTNSLGDFEFQYNYDPVVVGYVQEWRKELATLSQQIKEKNKTRYYPYPFLDPEGIPNSISI